MRLLQPIFRAGSYPQGEFTDEDVRTIAESYSPSIHYAPVKPGHSHDSKAQAFAWIEGLQAQGDTLYAEIGKLTPEFVDGVNNHRFHQVSPEIYLPKGSPTKKPYLRALALLGAEPPQVKGLPIVEFNDKADDYFSVDFDESFAEAPAFSSLEIAESGTAWDGAGAKKRIQTKYGWAGLKAYCLYRDPDADPESLAAYSFPVVDIIGGTPKIVPKAVSAGLAYLSGARGAKVSSEIAKEVRPKLEKLQKKIQKAQTPAEHSELGENPGGSQVKTLKEIIQGKAKGVVPDDKLVAFSETLASELSGRFGSANFEEEPLAGIVAELIDAKVTAFTEKGGREAAEKKAKEAVDKLAAEFAEKRKAAVSTRIAKLIQGGKFVADYRERLTNALLAIPEATTVQFSEDGKQENRPIADEILAIFEAQPKFVPDTEIAPPDDEEHTQFSEYVKAGDLIANTVNPQK